MNRLQTEIREQQKMSWNKFSPGWKKWDAFTMGFLKPMGDDIILLLDPQPGDRILDIATGTGEPGLTLASIVTSGQVTGVDISEGMIEIAKENAKAKGLNNYQALVADVCELPFPEESFDNLSCRMGFMFFPDMLLAATEMYRVLRTGGHMATCVWAGPENNTWIAVMMNTLKKHIDMPAPPPGAPGMFRCAAPGFMVDLLQTAGFYSVRDKKIKGMIKYDNPEHYWNIMTEVAAPLAAAMEKADEATKANIKTDLFRALDPFMVNGELPLPYEAIMLYGKK
jgi:ubiquinone/menaquinone biosynthesis C-methylase UbiE